VTASTDISLTPFLRFSVWNASDVSVHSAISSRVQTP
jgi:hypothetical protein